MGNTENKTFSIDAKVILNLGRERIKDHTTSLLELVKNSYDADATKFVCNRMELRRIYDYYDYY